MIKSPCVCSGADDEDAAADAVAAADVRRFPLVRLVLAGDRCRLLLVAPPSNNDDDDDVVLDPLGRCFIVFCEKRLKVEAATVI